MHQRLLDLTYICNYLSDNLSVQSFGEHEHCYLYFKDTGFYVMNYSVSKHRLDLLAAIKNAFILHNTKHKWLINEQKISRPNIYL